MTLFRDGRDPKKMPRLEGGDDKAAPGIPAVEEALALLLHERARRLLHLVRV